MRLDKIQPLPWKHHVSGGRAKDISAVIDANGNVVCGSLICRRNKPTMARQNHALIVEAVNQYMKGRK